MNAAPQPLPPEAVEAAERAAASRLDDLVADLDASLAKDGTYDADDVRTALIVVAREALDAAAPLIEARATRAEGDRVAALLRQWAADARDVDDDATAEAFDGAAQMLGGAS